MKVNKLAPHPGKLSVLLASNALCSLMNSLELFRNKRFPRLKSPSVRLLMTFLMFFQLGFVFRKRGDEDDGEETCRLPVLSCNGFGRFLSDEYVRPVGGFSLVRSGTVLW